MMTSDKTGGQGVNSCLSIWIFVLLEHFVAASTIWTSATYSLGVPQYYDPNGSQQSSITWESATTTIHPTASYNISTDQQYLTSRKYTTDTIHPTASYNISTDQQYLTSREYTTDTIHPTASYNISTDQQYITSREYTTDTIHPTASYNISTDQQYITSREYTTDTIHPTASFGITTGQVYSTSLVATTNYIPSTASYYELNETGQHYNLSTPQLSDTLWTNTSTTQSYVWNLSPTTALYDTNSSNSTTTGQLSTSWNLSSSTGSGFTAWSTTSTTEQTLANWSSMSDHIVWVSSKDYISDYLNWTASSGQNYTEWQNSSTREPDFTTWPTSTTTEQTSTNWSKFSNFTTWPNSTTTFRNISTTATTHIQGWSDTTSSVQQTALVSNGTTQPPFTDWMTTPTPLHNGSSPAAFSNITDCGLIFTIDIHNVTVHYYTGTQLGAVVIFTCPLGMTLYGNKTTTCLNDGTWSHPPPICYAKRCEVPPGPNNGFIQPPHDILVNASFNQTISFACNPGYTILGYSSITCNAKGQWSGEVPICIEAVPLECPGNKDNLGTFWNTSTAGQIVSQQCPQGYYGSITRTCGEDGEWRMPLYDCVGKTIEEISRVVEAIVDAPTDTLVADVLTNLTQETDVGNEQHLHDGEIIKVTEMLETIAVVSRNIIVSDKQKENFIRTASNVVDEQTIDSWKAIGQGSTKNTKSARSDAVMKAVEDYADAIVSSSQPFNDTEIRETNIVFSISKVNETNLEDLIFPHKELRNELNTSSFYSLPKNALKDVKHSSSVYYKTMDKILPSYDRKTAQREDTIINSPLLALKLIPYTEKMEVPLTLNFEHFNDKLANPKCCYWNFTINSWDSEGCRVVITTDTMTQCQCDHLTNFAILMSPYKQVVSHTLSTITLVGTGISVILLGITILVHIVLWKYIKTDRVYILMNLILALFVSYLLFIFGVEETDNKTVCTVIAVVLHYFLLLVFFMMLCVTIEIAMSVVFVFASKHRRSLLLLPVGWGIPTVIVTTSAFMSNLNGYGTSDYCWLSISDGLIWAFVGPALLVISVNTIMLVVILKKMFATKFMAQKSERDKVRSTLRSLCVLLPVMGVTWIFGVFYINDDTQWLQYVFTICNSLQGVVIFIFHCVLNKKIQIAVKQARRKYSVTTSSAIKLSNRSRDQP